MKLLFTNEWLRRGIASDPDMDAEAGESLHAVAASLARSEASGNNEAVLGERNVVQLRVALGTLVRDLRLKQGLTIEQLAERAQVSEDELRQVEHDPHYTARPRLIHQLSIYFGVALSMLSQLSGTTGSVDRALYNKAVKYAACSDELSELTDAQQEVLDAFVAVLNERSKSVG